MVLYNKLNSTDDKCILTLVKEFLGAEQLPALPGPLKALQHFDGVRKVGFVDCHMPVSSFG